MGVTPTVIGWYSRENEFNINILWTEGKGDLHAIQKFIGLLEPAAIWNFIGENKIYPQKTRDNTLTE